MMLAILFIVIPLIEIALFIQVGGMVGLWPTLAIVIATAIGGTYLLRLQGRAALRNLQNSFNNLSDPSRPLADGAMILFAGALLLTPGFFTDALGLSLMIPAVRGQIFNILRKRVKTAQFKTQTRKNPDGSSVIDGEFEEIPQDQLHKPDPHDPGSDAPGSSGWTKH